MADKTRLVGSDGKIVTVAYGTELNQAAAGNDDLDELLGGETGDGIGAGWYEITQISDDTSAFASGLAVGDLFWDDGSMVLDDGLTAGTSGDKVKPLTETEMGDVQSFSLEISKAEIDVTVLSDTVKRYRSGKTDMTGSIEGITTIGTTDAAGYVLNNFLRTIKQASAGTVTVSAIDDSPIYIKGVIQKDTSSGESEAFLWAKINLLSTRLGAGGEDAQSFTSNFRVAPGDPEPTVYIREVA